MTVALVTVAEVKGELPIAPGNSTFDARIQRYIDLATRQIEDATQREYDQQARVEFFATTDTRDLVYDFVNTTNEDGVVLLARSRRIVLKAAPILASPAIDIRYDPNRVWGDDTIIQPANYVVDAEQGVVTLTYPTLRSQQALRIAYTGGYASAGNPLTLSAAIPADLKQACISQVQFLFKKLGGDNLGMSSDQGEGKVPGGKFSSIKGLTPEVADMVSGYRRLLMGAG